MNDQAIIDAARAIFDDGLDLESPQSLLDLAGAKRVRRLQGQEHPSVLLAGHTERGSTDLARALRNRLSGQELLFGWLPALRSGLLDDAGELRPEYRQYQERSLDEGALIRLMSGFGESLRQHGIDIDIGILLAASALGRGLGRLLRHGREKAPIEAELGELSFHLKVLPGTLLALSAQGETSEPFVADRTRLREISDAIAEGQLAGRQLPRDGSVFWQALLPGSIGRHFERCIGHANAHGLAGVRIRLSIDDDDLLRLPWELARYDGTQEYVSVGRSVSLSRHVHLPVRPASRRGARTLYRVGLIAAEPAQWPGVMAQQEVDILRELEKQRAVQVRVIDPPTIQGLAATLAAETLDVVHFVGHGFFEEGVGALVFESSAEPGYEAVSAERLAAALPDARKRLPAFFLNGCETAVAAEHAAFLDMGGRLSLAGAPATIAHQYPVTNAMALSFAKEVYTQTGLGYPLAFAVQGARRALFLESGEQSRDFATPVLFESSGWPEH